MINPSRLRRLKLSLLSLVLLLAATIWVWQRPVQVFELGGVRAPRQIPLSDVNPWGANFFLDREPDAWTRRKTVEAAGDAGIVWAKQLIPWFDVEPQQGEFEFGKYDEIVDLYQEEGIELIARLDFPPTWVPAADFVSPEKIYAGSNFPPADVEVYADYVRKVASHFKGRICCYQIWNEPNLHNEWGYGRVDPDEYVELLASAARAIRSVDPDAVVLSAPLAVNNESIDQAGNLNEIEFLERMYAAGAAQHFDVLSINAFGFDRPPDDPADRETLNFQRARLQREVMEDKGDRCKAVWANEFGWNAAPDSIPSPWRQVSEEMQADWTVQAVELAEKDWPWAGVFSIWFFRRCCIDESDPVQFFQMMDEDFNARRLYASVQEAAANIKPASLGVWAERSRAVRLGRSSDWSWKWSTTAEQRDCRPEIPSRALDHRYLFSEQAGASLDFDFEGTEVAVRVEMSPGSGSLRYSVDGGELQTLPMKSAEARWEWLELDSGLSAGEHRLNLVFADVGGHIKIDAFRVGAERGLDPRSNILLALAGLMALLALLAAYDLRRILSRMDSI